MGDKFILWILSASFPKTRTKKQIDSLPKHAQHIFKKAHAIVFYFTLYQ
jgi:hypothetical protein